MTVPRSLPAFLLLPVFLCALPARAAEPTFPGCAVTNNVGSGQTYATIQSAVDALPSTLPGPSCVVIRDGATYAEQVTVRNFINSGSSITILADPASGLIPVVSPPLASTAAFLIANASVNILGIDISPANALPYGILISSAYAAISSVNVQDASGKIATAGIAASSWTAISGSSVTVGGSVATGIWLPGISGASVSRSTATANSSNAYAMRLSGATSNTIADSLFVNLPGSGIHLLNSNGNVISRSSIACDNGTGSNAALYLTNSSSNTVTETFLRNWYANAVSLNSGSNFNSISQSTAVLRGAGGQAAIGLNSSHYNNVVGCLLSVSGGVGINIGASNFNTVSQTTMAVTNGMGRQALLFNVASSNTVTTSYIANPQETGISYFNGSSYNAVSQSVIIGGPSSNLYPSGVYITNGSFNTISQSHISNPGGFGATFGSWALRNTISLSTITSGAAGYPGVYFMAGSGTNTVSGSYVQGSTAAYVVNVQGAVIDSSVLAGGAMGPGIFLDYGSSGTIVLSGNSITGALHGLRISTQSAFLSISSISFIGLASSATAVRFLGGTFVATVTAASFDASVSVNVDAAALNPASRVTMRSSFGSRSGEGYETDPSSLVDWTGALASAPTGPAASGVGLGAATLSWGAAGNPVGTIYELERSSGSGFGLRKSTTATLFVDAALTAGSTYFYRVRALNSELVASAYSSSITVVTYPVPARPAVSAITPSSGTTGTSFAASVAGSGFSSPAVLSLERASPDLGAWAPTGSLAQARMAGTLTKLYDGRVLYAGGMLEGSAIGLTAVEIYDPATGTWTAGPPLRVGRNQYNAVALADGRVLVAGGRGPTGAFTGSVEIYDPVISTWTTAAPMTVRGAFALAPLPDGRVLAAGGWDGVNALKSAEIYDPATDAWTAAAAMGTERVWPGFTAVAGKVLISGGSAGTGISNAEIYDPATNTWSAAGTMNADRYLHRLTVLPGGKVLAAGGLTADASEVYDLATGTWTPTGPLGVRRYVESVVLVNGSAMMIGGENGTTDHASTQIYDASSNTWRAGPALTGTRTWQGAVTLDDGRVLVAAGRRGLGGGTNLSSAELLSMPTAQILATGVAVTNAQNLGGNFSLAGAATGYWDVVVAGPAGRTGRLSGGFLAVYAPSAPAALAASSVGLGAATLSWGANGNLAGTVYELERSTGTGFSLRASTAGLSFIDIPLSPATTYYYRARARDAEFVYSAYTSTIAVVTPPMPVYPAPASVAPSSGAAGTSVPAAVAGSGFDGSASLAIEKRFVDQGVWTATGSFTQARFQGALIRLRDGRVLLAGGRLSSTLNGLANTSLFDPATGAWTAGPPLNQARSQHASVMLADGRVLISGGVNGAGLAAAEIYDPGLNAWTAAAPMAQVRHGHALALLPDGRVLAAGGWSGSAYLSSAEIYDPATNAWTAAPPMSAGRFYGAAATLSGGKILFTGGAGLDTAELYDPAANAWTAAGTMSTVHYLHSIAVLPDGRALVSGGSTPGGITNKADVYDPATNAWTATGPMAVARYTHATAMINGTPVVVGGEDLSTAFAGTELFDVATNAWRPGPSLTGMRTWPQIVALDDGRLLATGGLSSIGGANLNTAEVLVMPSSQVAATGVGVTNAQNMSGTFDLTGAATGYWDIVVRQSGNRVGRLAGGFLAVSTPAAPTGFSGAAASASAILWTWTDASGDEAGFRVSSGAVNLSGDLPAGTTSWLQSGLGANFLAGPLAVSAFNLAGTAESSTATGTTWAEAPPAPVASGVSPSSATIAWSAGANPAGTVFQLERSTGAGFGLQFAGAATSYYEGNLTPATTYYYRARALNAESVATAYSSTAAVVALPLPGLPAAAGAPMGGALGISSVTWNWSLAAGATSHNLYRAATGAYLSAATTSFVETGLTPNTAYGLRTAGVNLAGAGPLSAAATVYTLAAVPSGTAASVTSTTVIASWALNGNPAATVAELQRSTDAVAYSTLTAAAVSSYADADLLGCTTYYYRVRNVNGDGLPTDYAAFQGVTANTIPSPPAGLTASANAGGTVSLLWSLSPTEGVTGYRLYWDAGTGAVSYAAPLAVLGSTTTAFTTGVLTSSGSYTFALRSAHRCGVVETTGASAMSGAAAALPPVRAAIKEPDSGRRINGDRVTILGELISGTPSDAQQVVFQYKAAASSAWLNVPAANINHPNPDLAFPYFVHWDVTALAAGPYDLRAAAYDLSGVPDSAPPAVRVVVDPVTPDISETLTVEGKIKKDQTVSNAVLSVVETAGAGAGDPAVRVTLPPGVVNTTTATLSVIANPTITTAAPAGQTMVGSAIKIGLSNGQTALAGTAAIVMTYPDTVRFPSLLQIYYLDEATGAWSRDFTTTVDATSRTVTGNTPHFSTFVLMLGTAFSANLDSVQVYPVPYKPNGTNPDEGRPFSHGDANSGIIFANLASASEITIYTLSGRMVSKLDSPTIAGTVRWDARNQDGRDVASGAYFAVITAPGQKSVVKKLVIIR